MRDYRLQPSCLGVFSLPRIETQWYGCAFQKHKAKQCGWTVQIEMQWQAWFFPEMRHASADGLLERSTSARVRYHTERSKPSSNPGKVDVAFQVAVAKYLCWKFGTITLPILQALTRQMYGREELLQVQSAIIGNSTVSDPPIIFGFRPLL